MAFVRFKGIATEYAGEAFNRTITKKDGTDFTDDQTATYAMYDNTGTTVASGDLAKVTGGLKLQVPASATQNLSGRYLLLVELIENGDEDTKEVIGEYAITYLERRVV